MDQVPDIYLGLLFPMPTEGDQRLPKIPEIPLLQQVKPHLQVHILTVPQVEAPDRPGRFLNITADGSPTRFRWASETVG